MVAGAGTLVSEELVGSLKKITWTWVSGTVGSSGAVSSAAETSYTYNGALQGLVTVPGAGGSAPTASYDITVVDRDGVDVLDGGGASRATAATERVLAASMTVVANDTLKLNIANAGAANTGTVIIYIR